jgi:hypothetical protein
LQRLVLSVLLFQVFVSQKVRTPLPPAVAEEKSVMCTDSTSVPIAATTAEFVALVAANPHFVLAAGAPQPLSDAQQRQADANNRLAAANAAHLTAANAAAQANNALAIANAAAAAANAAADAAGRAAAAALAAKDAENAALKAEVLALRAQLDANAASNDDEDDEPVSITVKPAGDAKSSAK